VVEFLERRFAPLRSHRIAVFCGRGNNGGDGFVVARQLFTRIRPKALWVLCAAGAAELHGDAEINWRALAACGCPVSHEIRPEMRGATLVLDALLGTGLRGAPEGRFAEWIGEINTGFPDARVVAIDVPSGLASDEASSPGPAVQAHATVTFTAPKIGQVLPPNVNRVGELVVAPIGSPASLLDDVDLHLTEPGSFAPLLQPRDPGGHKGHYGHVLVWAGSPGKTGAAAMAGLAALRAGAGLVTAGSSVPLPLAPELMTAPIDSYDALIEAAQGKDVIALGPGLGTAPGTAAMVRRAFAELPQPLVIDADGLNCLAGSLTAAPHGTLRILTPHPGEMARLTGLTTAAVQQDRLRLARDFAQKQNVVLLLKGQRTIVAFPDGAAWINPTGSPAMATGGSGDILTGLLAGLLAQHPDHAGAAVLAGAYLHGLAGELAANDYGEQSVIAGDLLRYLPEAFHHARRNALDPI
jgi:NAD(P)H-hydrate epimerase